VERILLWPLGGLAFISFAEENSPKADALVAIAGPLTHIPQVSSSSSSSSSSAYMWALGEYKEYIKYTEYIEYKENVHVYTI
jgi:hypothetical protein